MHEGTLAQSCVGGEGLRGREAARQYHSKNTRVQFWTHVITFVWSWSQQRLCLFHRISQITMVWERAAGGRQASKADLIKWPNCEISLFGPITVEESRRVSVQLEVSRVLCELLW